MRVDNEYRKQQSNPLRASSDNAYLVSASLAWEPPAGRGFGIALTADNLTDDDYARIGYRGSQVELTPGRMFSGIFLINLQKRSEFESSFGP